ncbi:AAA family ATPase [archaeon]|nr:AAA family ATPase [archaeon]
MTKITITGEIGSGKTTIGKVLAKKIDCNFLSVGGLRREIAKERGLTIQELNKIGETENWTDKIVDKKQIDLGKTKKTFIFEGRLSWHFIPNSFKIFLKVNEEIGAKRVLSEKRDSEEKTNLIKEQIKINKKRSESDKSRYKSIYGIENFFDKKHFDLIIDTSSLTPEEVVEIILTQLKDTKKFKQNSSSFNNKMYDIFSKKEPTPIQKKIGEIVEIDFREKNSLVPSELIKKGLTIEFKKLEVADYLVKGVAIERKTARDFFSSLFDKRLFSQLENLQQYEKRLLIIEGNLSKENRLHPNALKGLLLSIGLDYQIPTIFTKDCEETANYLLIIAKKEKKELSINPKRKNLSSKEELQFILESFPKIGPTKAKKLLGKFKSLKKIFSSTEKQLEQILGKNSKEFLEIVTRKYSN